MLEANVPARSSFCAADKPQCVVVELTGGKVVMTDSKLGTASPQQEYSIRDWRKFLRTVDQWVPACDGRYRIGDLAYTPEEWRAFTRAAAAGEFDVSEVEQGVPQYVRVEEQAPEPQYARADDRVKTAA